MRQPVRCLSSLTLPEPLRPGTSRTGASNRDLTAAIGIFRNIKFDIQEHLQIAPTRSAAQNFTAGEKMIAKRPLTKPRLIPCCSGFDEFAGCADPMLTW
jgi:hypothetical protein